ncbi:hypothetical protein [Novosphingobium sp. JCM 18896]|uniref:hypothetical protein n=1 Tax=Novosphingobium sp. JCM 18896 TaxID=2989731 RepID=UPI002223ACCF|nr:hypothetical protein [Novosphingobium sp. JCM 18896]MCW1432116.1 hypothetical protein [Novosphingobium sp. JCM 18896]
MTVAASFPFEGVMMHQAIRDEIMEALANQLPKIVFKDGAMEMLLTDDAEGTVPAMRIVAMIEAHRRGEDMDAARDAFKPKYALEMSVSERMTRCISVFKYIHEWKSIRAASLREAQSRGPGPGRPKKR